jgi:hypothetical protein
VAVFHERLDRMPANITAVCQHYSFCQLLSINTVCSAFSDTHTTINSSEPVPNDRARFEGNQCSAKSCPHAHSREAHSGCMLQP